MSFPRYPEYKDSGAKWLGEVPTYWTIRKCSYIGRLFGSESIPEDMVSSEEGGIPFLKVASLSSDSTNVISWDWYVSEQYHGTLRPAKHFVVFPKRGAAIFLNKVNVVNCKAVIDPNLMGWEILGHNVTEYFAYTLKCRVLSELADVSTVPQINNKHVAPERFPVPPIEEQQKIADFLDHETAKIDTLIHEQKRLIELLKEKRQAVISHTVTKGLDPDVPMKDSGVEWLGDVPAHWTVVRVAALYTEAAEQGTPQLPVLRVSIHHGVSDRELSEEESDRKITRIEDREKYKTVRPGDLVYNMMRAWQGGFGAVLVDGLVSPAYVVARPQDRTLSRYVEMLLRTTYAIEEMRSRSHGITDFRLRLYWDKFKTMKIVAPPLRERELIMERIDHFMKQSGALEKEARTLIKLLQERRSALISAAVTGKIDVRDWKPRADESAFDAEVQQPETEITA